jgi:hypothetical protein
MGDGLIVSVNYSLFSSTVEMVIKKFFDKNLENMTFNTWLKKKKTACLAKVRRLREAVLEE